MKNSFYSFNKCVFIIYAIILHLSLIISEIYDNYASQHLEEGGYDLLDVNDYHNLKLIVSSSKKIYTGIPPQLKVQTEAELINSSSLITLNENYLLASCLNDSLLSKISLIDGSAYKILDYSDIDITNHKLEPPIKTCSLTKMENLIFIGYSEINYYEYEINNKTEIEVNKTNIIFKLNSDNLDSDSPSVNDIKYFIFPNSTILTSSTRQVECQPLKITNDENSYRLVCLFDTLLYQEDYKLWRFNTFATSINENFNGFEIAMNEYRVYRVNDISGFRFIKINDFTARCMVKKSIGDIYLELIDGKVNIKKLDVSKNISSFSSDTDLFDYNNGLLFSVEYKNPYYFRINKESSFNYFQYYDYNENGVKIEKIKGYYDEDNDYTILYFQTRISNYIKYFTLKDNKKIFDIGYISDTIRIKSNETYEYDVNELFDTSEYGKLDIDTFITYQNDDTIKKNLYDKARYSIENNKIINAQSLNYWFVYTFVLKDFVENSYIKLYHLPYVNLTIRTCPFQCGSCMEDYLKCDECRNSNYINLKLDNEVNENCYSSNQLIKGYVYDSNSQTFLKCYPSCEFCSAFSEDETDHKCESCAENYYPSYQNLGNCYKLNDSNFRTESCSISKILSTGECINTCPKTSFYYKFHYNYNVNLTDQTYEELESQQYTKVKIDPPTYLFNGICYDECPELTVNYFLNICFCQFGYHLDEIINCHAGLYCVSDNNNYRYFKEDTNECITEGCPSDYYQFNFRCYKDGCPDGTIPSEINSHECLSTSNFCYINENFENICNEGEEGYIYKFDDTVQYLKSCDESKIYTVSSVESYLFNNICYITCPTNTEISGKNCKCVNYGYYPVNGDIKCYSNEEKCGDDKIPVIDLKKCLNTIQECKDNNYKIFNNECYSENCPNEYNTKLDSDGISCICSNLFYNNTNDNKLDCFEDSITECPRDIYNYYNPQTKECFISLDDCITKGNNYFFNNNCYKNGCPSDKLLLSEQSTEKQNYFKNNLLLNNDNLLNKLCICNINTGVWNNIANDNQLYYQECLSQCNEGYKPESITKQCLEIMPTTIITTVPITTIITTQPFTTIITTVPITTIITTQPFTTIITTVPITTIITTEIDTTELATTLLKENTEITYPDEYYQNKENCKAIYENKCYSECPDGTCLTQDDPSLLNCIPIDSNVKVFNNICFANFDEVVKNIKSMSENDEIISTESGIIIRGYSTNSDSTASSDAKYSIVDLGDCEGKIREYYELEEDTELFILGIDSPNKDSSASTSVYNYGVYLENGTLLDHKLACQDVKISVSSVITNTELVKLDDAIYFSDLGYDIYNESSPFYTDNCASASVDGNDVTLSDRKKDFFPSGASLCNDSCYYSNVDLETKRFTCECDTGYNFSETYSEEEEEKEESSSYLDYFLSLINYKIGICYKLFFEFESYYYNAGFYISVGNLVFCLINMFVFLTVGMRAMNLLIKNNIPNKNKLKEIIKEKNEKKEEFLEVQRNKNKSNPSKKNIKQRIKKADSLQVLKSKNNKKIISKNHNVLKTEGGNNKSLKFKNSRNLQKSPKNKKKIVNSDKKLINITNSVKSLKVNNIKESSKKNKSNKFISFLIETEGKKMLKNSNKNDEGKVYSKFKDNKRKIVKDELGLISYINDDEVDKKEFNTIPYSQALRIDKRSYIEIFLSVLYHELGIISIFYYKSPFTHISLVISIYVFELCLDLALNCLLYTDDVVSEKYNNNGSIQFFTTLSLSFMSNIFAGIIAFIVGKLAEYEGILEMIIKNVIKQKEYYRNIIKFKKYLALKLTSFFIIQGIINLGMCYYLMIFCTVYHNTQGSIMVNYITGVGESMIISLGLSIIISLIRYLSIKNKWRHIYYTSRYLFETF